MRSPPAPPAKAPAFVSCVQTIEARIRGRNAAERRAVRQAETKPIMDALKARLMTALTELPSRSPEWARLRAHAAGGGAGGNLERAIGLPNLSEKRVVLWCCAELGTCRGDQHQLICLEINSYKVFYGT